MNATRACRVAIGIALLVGSVPVALYGFLLVVYRGESHSSGNTVVNVGGAQLDAQLLGSALLVLAFIAVMGGIWLLRRATGRP